MALEDPGIARAASGDSSIVAALMIRPSRMAYEPTNRRLAAAGTREDDLSRRSQPVARHLIGMGAEIAAPSNPIRIEGPVDATACCLSYSRRVLRTKRKQDYG